MKPCVKKSSKLWMALATDREQRNEGQSEAKTKTETALPPRGRSGKTKVNHPSLEATKNPSIL